MDPSKAEKIAEVANACLELFDLLPTAPDAREESGLWTKGQVTKFQLCLSRFGILDNERRPIRYKPRHSLDASNAVLDLLQGVRLALLSQFSQALNSGSLLEITPNSSRGSESIRIATAKPNHIDCSRHLPRKQLYDRHQQIEEAVDRLARLHAACSSRVGQSNDLRASMFEPEDEKGRPLLRDFEQYARFICQRDISSAAPEYVRERLVRTIVLRWRRISYQRFRATRLRQPSTYYLGDRQVSANVDHLTAAVVQDLTTPSFAADPERLSSRVGREIAARSASNNSLKISTNSSSSSSEASSLGKVDPELPSLRMNMTEIPLPPYVEHMDIQEGHFTCPVCQIPQPRVNISRRNWESHLMHDLCPYICLFEECKYPDAMFGTLESWIEHSTASHVRFVWRCPFVHSKPPDPENFLSVEDFKLHLQEDHDMKDGELVMIVHSSRATEPKPHSRCLFCGWTPPKPRKRKTNVKLRNHTKVCKHMAREHLRPLALTSLPWDGTNAEVGTSDQETWAVKNHETLPERSKSAGRLSDTSWSHVGVETWSMTEEIEQLPRRDTRAYTRHWLDSLQISGQIDFIASEAAVQPRANVGPLQSENQKQNLPSTALLRSAATGDAPAVWSFLRSSEKIKECVSDVDENGCTALHLAALTGSTECVRALIHARSDLNTTSRIFGTPLSLASAKGNTLIVKQLIDSGADVRAHGGGFGSALHAACVGLGKDAVDSLIKNGASVEEQRHFRHETPVKLQSMWLYGHNYSVRPDHLMDPWLWGDQLHITSMCRPLFIAVVYGRSDIVKFLAEHEASVNERADVHQADRGEDTTMTPLYLAALNGNVEIVRILLECGADPNFQESDTQRSALIATTVAGHTKCGAELLQYASPVNAKDSGGRTAVMYAAQLGHGKIFDLLLDKGALVDLQDIEGRTSLMRLAVRDDIYCAEKLVEKTDSINIRDEHGKSALMIAAESGNYKFVQLLLNLQANMEFADQNNNTALTLAAAGGHGKCVSSLLDHGASMKPKNLEGNDALDIAFANDDVECVFILVAHGADLRHLNERYRLPELLWRLKGLLESNFDGRVYESQSDKRKFDVLLQPKKVQTARSRLERLREELGPLPSQVYPRGDLSPQWRRAIDIVRRAGAFR